MAGTVKGIIIEIGGDTSGLQKALSKVNSQSSSLSKELRGINSLLKLDPKNVELLEQKQTVLNESIKTTQDKLNQLKKAKEEADKKMADGTKISEENYRSLQREIVSTERKLGNLTEELKQFNVANSNWTKAGKNIEEYGDKINKVSNKIDNVGNKLSAVSATAVAGGAVLVNSAMNVEDVVAKYISTTKTAQEETEKYKEILENINRNNYGEGYEDIANSMSQVKMQLKDINAENLQNITEKAIALRDLFGYEVSESIRAVKAMMDNFNISADEAFNLIAEGKKQGLDFSNELLDNVNEYSVQFNKLGLSAQDMFNIFKVGAENGAFNLDKIGDAVKEFSIRVIDGSNTTIEGFKKLGLNANTMAKKFAQGGDVAKQAFIEVVQKIGSMNNRVEQSIVGVDLFGTMWEDLGPTVVTSFSKMDNGISQSSNSMQKSIDELYNTTKKKAEAQLKRLQSLGADFGKEMLPTLEKIIDKAEDFINCLEEMSDEEKENIVKIGLLVAGMGPLTKTVGTAGKVIGTTTKGIRNFSGAVANVKNGVKTAEGQVGTFTTILTKMTSPVGLATLGITALTAAVVYLATMQTEAQKKAKQLANEMSESKKSLEEYNKGINNSTEANISHINSVSKLKDELYQLVDENGKVKDSYGGRVAFILNELNNALGTEYKLNGNIIESYQNLRDEIDSTIKKKKAEILLNASEEKYKNAIENQTEAVKKLKSIQDELGMSVEEAKQKYKDYTIAVDEASKKGDTQAELSLLMQSKEMTALKNKINAYEDAEWQIQEYTNATTKYQEDYANFVEGKYDELGTKIVETTSNWCDATITEIENSIAKQSDDLEKYKQQYEATGNEVSEQCMKQAQSNLETLAEELANRTSTIGTLGENEVNAWKTLATNSYDVYKEKISKMSPEMQQEIQNVTGVVISDSTIESATENLAENANSGFNNNVDGEKWGKDLLKNLIRGLSNTTLLGSLANTASDVAGTINSYIHHSVPDKGPLKDEMKYMPDMIDNLCKTLDKSSPKLSKKTLQLAEMMANNLNIENLQGNLSNKIINDTKTVFTTPQIIFNVQELDEAKLQQCFNFVNNKFGSKY